jgi:hypothetical protein
MRCAAHTYAQVQQRKNSRKLRHLSDEVNSVLTEMRKGGHLNLSYVHGRPAWRLTSGQSVSAKAATIITASDGIVGANDSLFPDHPGQIWSFRQ